MGIKMTCPVCYGEGEYELNGKILACGTCKTVGHTFVDPDYAMRIIRHELENISQFAPDLNAAKYQAEWLLNRFPE